MNIALLGTVGIPNCYGGFESFLERLAPSLKGRGHKVVVSCDATKYKSQDRFWNGIERVFVPFPANGAPSMLHDVLAIIKTFWKSDVICIFGVSAGITFPILKVLSTAFGKTLVVNADGIEWRRSKFSGPERWLLFLSDICARLFADIVIIDNKALLPFARLSDPRKVRVIAYPGDHSCPNNPQCVKDDSYALTICRIEPENQCDLLLRAFVASKTSKYIFVGNWQHSNYGRTLRQTYAGNPRLDLRDQIYDANALAELRRNCDVYLHGHSVGGTNPSLVEMLFFDCRILAFDCPFNRETAGTSIEYFGNDLSLTQALDKVGMKSTDGRQSIRAKYTLNRITTQYVEAFGRV